MRGLFRTDETPKHRQEFEILDVLAVMLPQSSVKLAQLLDRVGYSHFDAIPLEEFAEQQRIAYVHAVLEAHGTP